MYVKRKFLGYLNQLDFIFSVYVVLLGINRVESVFLFNVKRRGVEWV